MNDSNIFWSDDINVLFEKNNLHNFFPTSKHTLIENLNSTVRLFLYLSVALVLYTRNPKYFMLPVFSMLVTYVLFTYYPDKEEMTEPIKINCEKVLKEKKISKKCVSPTTDNPFMNFNHISDDYHRPPACKAFLYNDQKSFEIKKEVEEKFNEKLYRDVGDLYSKRNSQREFYSVAYNGIPDQTSFAKWLYKVPGATCKENSLKCGSYTGTML